MKTRFYVFIAIVAALLAMTVSMATAQMTRIKRAPEKVLAALKPGLTVKISGTIQKDFSALCLDIKTLPADLFKEDDWEITAPARKIDSEKREFALMLVPIKLQPTTKFKDKSGAGGAAFKSFDDLKPDMLVEAGGTYLKDGTFLTTKIENVSSETISKPEKQNEVQVKGKIEKIDTVRRTVHVAGVTFSIVNETEFKTALK
jgi:hypothetical protein